MKVLDQFIARWVVQAVWLQYGRQIRIATGLGLAALLMGGSLGYRAAKREPPER
jgi:hypothetical protein